MLREFLDLVIMQLKTIKAYLPAFLFFSFLFPMELMLVFGYISIRELSPYVATGTITFYIYIGVLISVAQSLAFERSSGRFSLMRAAVIPKEVYAISIALSNGLATIIMIPIILVFRYVFSSRRDRISPLSYYCIDSINFYGLNVWHDFRFKNKKHICRKSISSNHRLRSDFLCPSLFSINFYTNAFLLFNIP